MAHGIMEEAIIDSKECRVGMIPLISVSEQRSSSRDAQYQSCIFRERIMIKDQIQTHESIPDTKGITTALTEWLCGICWEWRLPGEVGAANDTVILNRMPLT